MKKFIKRFDFLGIALVIVISSTNLVACQSTETKKVETETTVMPEVQPSMEQKDSLPVLDTTAGSSTRPETIKNH